MRLRLAVWLLCTLLAPSAANANSDKQLWSTVGVNVNVAPKWRISEEFVMRFSDDRSGLYEVESSTLVAYRLNKVLTVAAGYVHNPLYRDDDFLTTEHRAREQVTFDNFTTLGPGKLSARLRAEQRWRDNADGTAHRIRPYVKFSMPVSGKLALNLSNETFINLNNTSFQQTDGFDRMRNLITLSLPLSPRLTGEAGYLNQYGFVRSGPDTMDHVAYFALSFTI